VPETLEAIYDGNAFRPTVPCQIEPNTRVWITVNRTESAQEETRHFLRTARSLNLDGPSDWSANLERYLYDNGTLHGE